MVYIACVSCGQKKNWFALTVLSCSLPDIWNVTGQKIKVLLTRLLVCMIQSRGRRFGCHHANVRPQWTIASHHPTVLDLLPYQLASRKTAACFALLRGKVYEAMENLEPNEGWNETYCGTDSWKPLAERNDIFVKPVVWNWIFSIQTVSSCEDHNALACYSHLHFLQKAALFLA